MKKVFILLISLAAIFGSLLLIKNPLDTRKGASSNIEVQKDITYKDNLKANVCRPTSTPPSMGWPVVILIHGGGFYSGDNDHFYVNDQENETCINLASKGFVVFSPEYSLNAKYPTAIKELQYFVRALRYYVSIGNNPYHIDPGNITAWGVSSGGHLAVALGSRDSLTPSLGFDNFSSKVNYVINESGPQNFNLKYWYGYCKESQLGGNSAIQIRRKIELAYIPDPNNFPSSCLPSRFKWAPYSTTIYINRYTAPVLSIHGTNDTLISIEESRYLHNSLNSIGIRNQLIEIPGMTHGQNPEKIKSGTLNSIINFIKGTAVPK